MSPRTFREQVSPNIWGRSPEKLGTHSPDLLPLPGLALSPASPTCSLPSKHSSHLLLCPFSPLNRGLPEDKNHEPFASVPKCPEAQSNLCDQQLPPNQVGCGTVVAPLIHSPTFILHQLCGDPGWALGSGPETRGVGYPFLGHLLTYHLGQASERLSKDPGPTHPSSFLSLSLTAPRPPPAPRGRWPDPRPFLGRGTPGQVRRTTGRKGSPLRGVQGAERAALRDLETGAPSRTRRPRVRIPRTRPSSRPPHLPGP